MRAAGIRELGGPVQLLELPGPRGPGPDEVLIEVRASGVGNWDDLVRTGDWDTGSRRV
ncbi:MAG TPA: NADP-dependent oxidoreductase, partial [Actinobacteria bacterium]|nr:NADP-dependent oxidoreductase [Actinomycetota bacterium]